MTTLRACIEAAAIDPNAIELIRLRGREALGVPYELEIELVGAAGVALDEEAILGAPARIVLELGTEPLRTIHGVVQQIQSGLSAESDRLSWILVLRPRVSDLSLTTTTEIAMEQSVPEIVRDRLERLGFEQGKDFELNLQESYEPREFVVQFKEAHLAFVSRLCEHVGVTMFFRQAEDRDVVAFADAPSGFLPEARIPFRPRGEKRDVFDLRAVRTAQPARVRLKDYNYRTPGVALSADAEAAGTTGERFSYGEHFKTPDEGAHLARVRAEELAWQKLVYVGRSARAELTAGMRLVLEGHPQGDKTLLIVEVEHTLDQAGGLFAGPSAETAYENRFKAIDAHVPFRPLRSTPKPYVPGVLTGIVEAAQAGQYAEIDSDGRYHVRFAFDSGPAARGKASRPIRMAQPHAGQGYGFHFPLRDGVEVVLSCVEGDPDRPIISGAVPNPTTPSTVGSTNGMRNVIRTGGGTEINIDDEGGSERLKISVPFGNTVLQLGAPNAPAEGIYMGTDKKIHVNSSEGMTFVDGKEIKGQAPEVWWHGTSTAGVHGNAKAELSSGSLVHVEAPTIEHVAANVHRESAPVITSTATGAWSAHSGGVAVVTAGASVNVQAPTVTTRGTLISIQGDMVTIEATGAVTVTGPTVNVTGDGVVNVKGGQIKLNVG